MPNRLISDNILVNYECVENIIQRKLGKQGKVAMKLDMSKPYDMVEWFFLEAIMRRMGLPPS